jgi:pimeloyl-ACP methyl ester carboxylesterase
MSKKKRHVRISDMRGYSRLAIDATLGLTTLVEIMHHNILRTPGILGEATQHPARGITGFVYKSIRGVTELVGDGIDRGLGLLAPLIDDGISSSERDAVLAALNGILGDHLEAGANTLAIPMQLRREGKPLELTRDALRGATGKVLLVVHGLCMNDLQWRRHGHDHAAALAADGGFSPVYVRYNSGLHVSTNGRALSEQIQTLVRAWPVPIDELVILAHSMGGLVTRSACHHAALARHDWLQHLRQIVFLGTPHHGTPLERGGNWTNLILESSPYTIAFARLGKVRSAGITDLRHGSLLDGDWQGKDRFARSRPSRAVALPSGVKCTAIAASIARKKDTSITQLLGDGLVPLDSALGRHVDSSKNLAIPKTRQWVGYGMNHMDLLDRKEVYAQLRRRLCR